MRYSIEPKDQICVKNIVKSLSKTFCGKYKQELLDYAKQCATNALKTASKEQFKRQQKQLVISLVVATDAITRTASKSSSEAS